MPFLYSVIPAASKANKRYWIKAMSDPRVRSAEGSRTPVEQCYEITQNEYEQLTLDELREQYEKVTQ